MTQSPGRAAPRGEGPLTPRYLASAGIVAALYAALTLLFAPISFSQVQFRVAEALTLLPVLSRASVPGLFLGCLAANFLAGQPWQDVVFGSLATLAAAALTRMLRRSVWLAALMPVLLNAAVVGSVLHVVYGLPLLLSVLTVGAGEAAVCYLLGVPLVKVLDARGIRLE
ncbi:MAG TPA: QueT transporter family protein [Candidatus Limnocylindria bacterium]|nr:QueT transporter family protein [Candidatus Limnocylindria bacterium]